MLIDMILGPEARQLLRAVTEAANRGHDVRRGRISFGNGVRISSLAFIVSNEMVVKFEKRTHSTWRRIDDRKTLGNIVDALARGYPDVRDLLGGYEVSFFDALQKAANGQDHNHGGPF